MDGFWDEAAAEVASAGPLGRHIGKAIFARKGRRQDF
jgi:hypothetical protein